MSQTLIVNLANPKPGRRQEVTLAVLRAIGELAKVSVCGLVHLIVLGRPADRN
jgi:hypothetical protein